MAILGAFWALRWAWLFDLGNVWPKNVQETPGFARTREIAPKQSLIVSIAHAANKVWGGGKPGRSVRLSIEKEKAIRQLNRQGDSISEIARVVGLSRPTIYKALG